MQIATLQFARKRYRGSSVNDVTLEGGGVQTKEPISRHRRRRLNIIFGSDSCDDVGRRGRGVSLCDVTRPAVTAGLVFTFITFPLCTMDDHFSSSGTMNRPYNAI